MRRAARLLEDIGGVRVAGYRAATFSIGAATPGHSRSWPETGYRYSSSVNPIRHDLYGMPDAPRFPFRVAGGALLEIPMTTLRRCGRRNCPVPAAAISGCCPMPSAATPWPRVNRREGQAGIFYFHPWEIDPGQPRVADCGWKSRLRHYTNLARMARRSSTALLRDFAWDRMDRVFAPAAARAGRTLPQAASQPAA